MLVLQPPCQLNLQHQQQMAKPTLVVLSPQLQPSQPLTQLSPQLQPMLVLHPAIHSSFKQLKKKTASSITEARFLNSTGIIQG
jgi:hypothetical protein